MANYDSVEYNNKSHYTIWDRLSHLFHHSFAAKRKLSTTSSNDDSSSSCNGSSTANTSSSDLSNISSIGEATTQKRVYRKKRTLRHDTKNKQELPPAQFVLPPFSPTYCKANEFPYSNFYVKLPDGKWMIRYRSGNRDILGTDVFEAHMI